jgi:cytosine/adenosine deaminase-related metal-dependent hydrolase
MALTTFIARWVFPVDQPPIKRGTVTIEDGIITDVAPQGTRKVDVDLGNAAIVPGFVNAHTHLDLSDAQGAYPPTSDFTAWLRQVVNHRRQQSPVHVQRAVADGIRESLSYGVTAIGDIAVHGASWDLLAASPLDAVVYHEAIGINEGRGSATFERIRDWFESRPRLPHCRPGISPHAPYTVGRWLLQKLVEYRQAKRASGIEVPFALHLAETRDELELLSARTGRFVEFLQQLGIYDAAALTIDLATWLACDDAAFIHANYADPAQLARSRPRAVVYCPRTHAAFGHAPYPLREYLAAGVTVALGTDSPASNPDLNVLGEAQHVFEQFPDVGGASVLRMLTANGARALSDDFARRTGTLSPGKDATFNVLLLPNRDEADPHRLLFDGASQITRVMIRGQWMSRTGL